MLGSSCIDLTTCSRQSVEGLSEENNGIFRKPFAFPSSPKVEQFPEAEQCWCTASFLGRGPFCDVFFP